MKIAVYGTGYVGLTTGACLAEMGNRVTCVDIDEAKIGKLKRGEIPFYEPGLERLVTTNMNAERIGFSTDRESPVNQNDVIMIAVGTPSNDSGNVDLSQIREVSKTIAKSMKDYRLIVNKSTVPPGTGEMIIDIIKSHYQGGFDLVHDIEFLREGTAVSDFMHPDRIVIGHTDKRAVDTIKELYAGRQSRFVLTDLRTAEVIKYACNAYLATSISFINSIADVCDSFGADVTQVSDAMRMDKRIGPLAFLDAGVGYGGSCLPKDIRCLIETCKENGIDHDLLRAVEDVNRKRLDLIYHKLTDALGGLKDKSIGIWGLSFKPESDDMRDAPSIRIINRLQKAGASISVFDPVASKSAKKYLPDIRYCRTPMEAAEGCDAVIIMTEWEIFRGIDKKELKDKMTGTTVIDGRNMLNKEEMKAHGFNYVGLGR